MNCGQTAAILIASIALFALLGCVKETPSGGSGEDQQQAEGGGQQAEDIGPEFYDSEQQAFDALNQEIEGLEGLSSEGLEALLGE